MRNWLPGESELLVIPLVILRSLSHAKAQVISASANTFHPGLGTPARDSKFHANEDFPTTIWLAPLASFAT